MKTALTATLLLTLSACEGGVVQVDPNRQAFVEDYVDTTLLPTLDTFVERARALEESAAAYAAAPDETTLAAAQETWRAAAIAWQHAELMTVGPAGAMLDVAGGEDLRDDLYSWPLVNPCRVDQETLTDSHADTTLLAEELVNVRGLAAIEYLLFDADDENDCTAVSAINAMGEWEAARESIPARRAAYAHTAAALVAMDAEALVARWRNGFREKLVDAPSDVYPSNQEALNAISDALFYLDTETKDMKLGEPAGLVVCMTDTCPESRESRFANHSLVSIAANIDGFALVFRGAEGRVGLEELLRLSNAGDLADRFNAAIDGAVAAAALLTDDVPTLLAENPRGLMPLYDAVKRITDLMKTELLSVLDLELPDRADGDND